MLIAVDAQAFLADVGLAVQVLTEGGDGHGKGVAVALAAKVQFFEDAHHIVRGDGHARALLNVRHAGGDDLRGARVGIEVDHAGYHVARVQKVHQHAGAVERVHHRAGGHAALKAAAALRAHAQSAAGQADGRTVERRALEHHVRGALGDLALLAAHDAGQARGALLVTDDQVVGAQGALVSVQRGQRLAGMGAAHHDLPPAHLAQVKGVHGMAVFDHDVVGDIHDVVDGAKARAVQVLAQPQGRGRDAHVFDHARGVARAQVRSLHAHLHLVMDIPARFGHGDFGGMELGIQRRRRLARDADGAQAVRAVGQNLKIHRRVVDAQNGLHIRAQGVVLLEYQNALFLDVGIELRGHVKLLAGADHALGDHAPQLALFDLHAAGQVRAVQRHGHQLARRHVGRAAHDVQRLRAAHVHGALMQVRALHVRAREHAAHHDLLHAAADILRALHSGAGHNHPLGIFLRRDGDIRILPDHIHRQFH